jgi:hypothetical protein
MIGWLLIVLNLDAERERDQAKSVQCMYGKNV